jgi:FtsH-binding integral membrane protein
MTARIRLLPLALRLLAVILVAAAAFGLWHVVIGGLVNANARAAAFGTILATASVVLFAGVVAVDRRLRRG